MAALSRVHTTERGSTPQIGELDDTYVDEGRRLLDRACTGDQGERGQTAVIADELIDRAKRSLAERSLSPSSYARVLRAAALIRNMARLPELPPDPLVHDLVSHTVQHGLAAHNAAAQALRGTLAVSRGEVDVALDAAVDSMATVELLDEGSVELALAMSDTAALLDQLGLCEVSAELYGNAAEAFAAAGIVAYQLMMTADCVRTQIEYGMWLERTGQEKEGAVQFEAAAELARAGLQLWRETQPPPELDDDFASSFHAAIALVDPTGDHEETLRKATGRIVVYGQIVARLVLVRLLIGQDRHAEAGDLLRDLRLACLRFHLPMPLRLALARGVLDLPRDSHYGSATVVEYVTRLEDELWGVHGTRGRALKARLEHERLRRGREPMRSLTAKDPVTGLPDRSVLDEELAALADAILPTAVAMVDIDDMVQINQRGSFADGDAVLRAVAVTVRSTVRPEDSVIRYSADEIIVIMPGRTLEDAADTMRRVVNAVTRLPHDRGHGATVSIGVVSVEPGEGGESVLVRADEATIQAKGHGGNQVAASPATPSPR